MATRPGTERTAAPKPLRRLGVILVDPLPRTLDMICDAETRARLEALGPLVVSDDARMARSSSWDAPTRR